MRDGGQVVRLLDRTRCEQRHPGLPACHHVGVVAEDRERVRRDGARRHVQAAGGQLPRDLVEVRDHQEETLRGRERGRESARLEGAVDGTGGTAFGLHFDHGRHRAPDVRPARGRPFVGQLTHGGARGDRVDRDDLAQAVRDGCHGFVAVDGVQGGHGCHLSLSAPLPRARETRPRSYAAPCPRAPRTAFRHRARPHGVRAASGPGSVRSR